ncbi:hypothetical protein I552_10172 [Mycobacterium xenopi 3993]|nr:hypothetical protein I552_10172 [Mycobacterium xenopi 3993]
MVGVSVAAVVALVDLGRVSSEQPASTPRRCSTPSSSCPRW